jgi:hypothetical protein
MACAKRYARKTPSPQQTYAMSGVSNDRIKATGAKAKTPRQTFKDANLSQGKINRRLSGI